MALSYGRYQDVPIRPLNKGMFTDLPRNGIPSGGFEDIKNMRVKEGYLETRGGLHPFYDGSTDLSGDDLLAYNFGNLREKIQEVVYHWKTVAQSETLVITDQFLYSIKNRTTLEPILLVSPELAVTPAANGDYIDFIVDSGDDANVEIGDYIRESGDTVIYGRILAYDGTTYTMEVDPSYVGTPALIEVVMAFKVAPGYKVDHTVLGGYGTDEAGNEMILTDQSGRGVYVYTEGTLAVYDIDSSPDADADPLQQTLGSAKACAFFDDRLWLGNITETSGLNFPQRIWWSDALDFDRFDPVGYIDLPYSQGELLGIKPMGSMLILYFVDTIYIGRPTQIYGRPYEFQELNTNGIGLVAQGAITTYDDGHFFVGQDDVYYLTGSGGLQRIGSPVRSVTVENTALLGMLDYVQVSSDPATESVVFLFPDLTEDAMEATGMASKLWRFYYKPQAWAYDEVPMIEGNPQAYFSSVSAARTVTKGTTYQDWADLDGAAGDPVTQTNDYVDEWLGDDTLEAVYSDGDGHTGQEQWSDLESYDDLNSFAVSVPRLFAGIYFLDSSGYWLQNIVYEAVGNNQDVINETTYDIDFQLISADYDFGVPDSDKLTRQFSVRTMEHADEYFQPTVWVSDGKARINSITGRQEIWYQKAPTVKYFSNYNEGRTGFLTRGSIFKFKMQFTRTTERYRISEIVIRTKVEGAQIDL